MKWILLIAVLMSGNALAARRVAVLVGANKGWTNDARLYHAEDDARRIGAVLSELGGFAAENVVILTKPNAKELLAQLESASQKLAASSDQESLFIFYYSGHSDDRYLHLPGGGDPLSFEELYKRLRDMPSTVKLGILDSCRSGSILATKGATLKPEFKVDVREDPNDVSGTVILTSSGADELSQEVGALSGSVFTHHLVSGLRGAADKNGDQRMSLEEVYNHAYYHTLADTAARFAVVQHPSFKKELKGRGNLYLTQHLDLYRPSLGALLFPPGERRCFVVTQDNREVLAEAFTRQEAGTTLALAAPGEYQLKCVDKEKYQVAPFVLRPGEQMEVTRLTFRDAPLSEGIIKGSPSELAEALARKLMLDADRILAREPERMDLGVLLAMESLKRTPSSEARSVLIQGLQGLPSSKSCVKHGAEPLALAWSPNGKHLATAGMDKEVRIWNLATRAAIAQVSLVNPISAFAWSQDGSHLTMRDQQGEAFHWQFKPGKSDVRKQKESPVYVAAFDPSGLHVALMDQGETLLVRQQGDGTDVLREKSMKVPVNFSADGRFLAALDAPGRVRVWDLTTLQEMPTAKLGDPASKVSRLAISSDGRFLALWELGGKAVQIWDIASARQISVLTHDDTITDMDFVSSSTLVTASSDKTIRLWDVATKKELQRLPHQTEAGPVSVSISPDGQWLAATQPEERSVRIWSARTGQELTWLSHPDAVKAVAWGPREGWIATASADGTACVWELTGAEAARMPGWGLHSGMLFSQSGQLFVTATEDEPACIWESSTGRKRVCLEGPGGAGLMVLSPDGKFLVTASGALARVWDVATGKLVSSLLHEAFIHALAFSPDGAMLASASRDGTARLWDAAKGQERLRVKHDGPVKTAAFSPDGQHLLTGGEDQTARLWDVSTGKELQTLEHKALPCEKRSGPSQEACKKASLPGALPALDLVRFSPDGRYLATSTLDAVARLWETQSGKELWHQPQPSLIRALAFTPDGRGVAIATGEPVASIWNVGTGKEQGSVEAEDGISLLQYSMDGKYLLTSSVQGMARIWETNSGSELARMLEDQEPDEVLLSPDGRYLATARDPGNGSRLQYSLYAWLTEDLAKQACQRLQRNLTQEEWHQYLGDAEPYQKTCNALP